MLHLSCLLSIYSLYFLLHLLNKQYYFFRRLFLQFISFKLLCQQWISSLNLLSLVQLLELDRHQRRCDKVALLLELIVFIPNTCLLCRRHCTKSSLYINTFDPNNLCGRYFYYSHSTNEEIKAKKFNTFYCIMQCSQ